MQESVITSYFIAQVTALIPDQIYGARLLIDGEQKNNELIQRVRKTLSDFGHHLSDVKARDSRLEDGIQIADMIAGAVLDQLQGEPSSFDRIQHSVKFEEFEAKTRR